MSVDNEVSIGTSSGVTNEHWFDRLAKGLATGVNRRAFLVRLGASALGVLSAPFVGSSIARAAQTVEMGRGQCDSVPDGSLVVGDAELADGTKLYPYPQSGEFGNMTWMNQAARVCFPYGGKYRTDADRDYQQQKMQEALTSGCQENRGCNGVYVWHFPGNLPAGEEVRHSGTGANGSDEVCPEPVLDKIIKVNAGWQTMHRRSRFDGDGPVAVDGTIVYEPDNNARTGQQVRNYSRKSVQVRMDFGGDYECVSLDIDVARERADEAVRLSKEKQGFRRVSIIEISRNGEVSITRR